MCIWHFAFELVFGLIQALCIYYTAIACAVCVQRTYIYIGENRKITLRAFTVQNNSNTRVFFWSFFVSEKRYSRKWFDVCKHMCVASHTVIVCLRSHWGTSHRVHTGKWNVVFFFSCAFIIRCYVCLYLAALCSLLYHTTCVRTREQVCVCVCICMYGRY